MIFQLQPVPGHFSHIPAARCGCFFGMGTCLQVGRVFPTEIGKLLQFCQLFPLEGAVYPIPAETLGNPGSPGMWLFIVIPSSFLSRIFFVETETWRCLIPQGAEHSGQGAMRVLENRSEMVQK